MVTPNLGFDSSHYFAPLVALNVVAMGVAVAAAIWAAVRVAGRLRARRDDPGVASAQDQKVQAPVR